MTTITPPAGDTRVYVTISRRRIPAHQLAGDGSKTVCGRSTRSGTTLWADYAIATLDVTWCEPCWRRP